MSTDTTQQETATSEVEADSAAPKTNDGPIAIQATGKPAGAAPEAHRGDVSASTIARMMGMATAAEFRVLEGKVDLLSTKLNSVTGKLERIVSSLANVPSGSDLERIDVQVSSLRTALGEAMTSLSQTLEEGIKKMQKAQKGSND